MLVLAVRYFLETVFVVAGLVACAVIFAQVISRARGKKKEVEK